jgi:chemotaxis protein MotB
VSELESEKAQLEQRIAQLESDLDQWEAQAQAYGLEPDDPAIVSKTVEQTLYEKDARIVSLEQTVEQKDARIVELEGDVQELERELQQAEQRLAQVNVELEQIEVQNALYERQVADLQQENKELLDTLDMYEMIQHEAKDLQALALQRIREVLKDEIASGEVRVFKGSLGITLDIVSAHMFASGEVALAPKGEQILGKIASLFDEFDGYFIGVIGNTDSKPIVSRSIKAKYPTNWELSSVRGAAVVRFLLNNSSIDPNRMVAMGLGEYQPIDDNLSQDGRGNNRRIDIVLLPIDVLAAVAIGAEIK